MAEPQLNLTVDGQELRQQDANLLGKLAGLGPDYALAEILRLAPFDGTTTTKAILPYGTQAAGVTPGTVIPTGSANASVTVQPFRAIVGSRTSVGTDAVANWRDIRTALWTGSATALAANVAFAANSSGNPRWDVVYAVIDVDVQTGPTTYRVKDPVTKNVTFPTIDQVLTQPITITVLPGTPASTPSVPNMPADGAGVYNIPLAAVRIPNGFNSLTTIAPQDIRDIAPVVSIAAVMGAPTSRPANGNNDGAGTYATNYAWNAASAGTRPSVWMPPSMVGGHTIFVAFDVTSASTPSFVNGAIVDSSLDWRNRIVQSFVAGGGAGTLFAMDPASTSSVQRVPSWNGGGNGVAKDWQIANTFYADGNLVSTKPTVYFGTPSTLSVIGSGATVGLYVEPTDGTLRAAFTGTPAARLFFILMVSGRTPNF